MNSSRQAAGHLWDAIVVGSGASGGVAAMTLAGKGVRVLVVDAGPDLTSDEAFAAGPGNLVRRLAGLISGRHRCQAQHPGYWKANPRLYADERLYPYQHPPDRPFLWTRGLQVGGRSLTWGGITLRLSDEDFAGVQVDGERVSWPISSRDLTPHYSVLEKFFKIHGAHNRPGSLPDGDIEACLPSTEAEQRFVNAISNQLGYNAIPSRGFGPHDPNRDGPWPRSSSCGSTLPRAMATGRAQLLPNHLVERVTMSASGSKATGVIVVNQRDGTRHSLHADLIVLAASTINTVSILLRSSEYQQPGGLVDPSGRLGTRLMDHVATSQFFAMPGPSSYPQPDLTGAGSFFVPFGRHLNQANFQGGYGLWGGIGRFDPPPLLKRKPNTTTGFLIGHGEVLPRAENRVTLQGQADRWGVASPHINCRWSVNELSMVTHMRKSIKACIFAAGGEALPIKDLFHLPILEAFLNGAVALTEGPAPPGYYIHEVGGAPLGSDERTSVLDPSNRLWKVPNLLVVDGACWPTSAWQSPTLTMMAISRRACLLALSNQAE
ncbi:GMC family oxidoreductase [Synechococcus sp. M16CYN]|uniref:GMC family oxidoreductase n=1 Tax=Synechococcus sp. M16CYN TaxID=3103139 RepID=UPI003244579C